MSRHDREDLTRQTEAAQHARDALAAALDDLAADAAAAARAVRRGKRPPPTSVLDDTHAAHRAVERAEEALDLAAHDLHTAQGGDA